MIIVSIEYDAVTSLLAGCAATFTGQAGGRVSQALRRALSAAVQAALAGDPSAPLVFFGHGTKADGPVCQDRVGAVAGRSQLLANRFTCGFCCFSINALAGAVQKHRATVLGFDGKFWLTTNHPAQAPYFVGPLLKGLDRLLNGGDAAAARQDIEDEFRRLAQQLLPRVSLTGPDVGNALVVAALLKDADRIDVDGNPARHL
jgi:hypothetical protein